MPLDSLYQEIILDHNRRPRNYRTMAGADRTIEGNNPLCGDQITLWLKFDGDRIADVSFQGVGCAVSKASASLMTAAVKDHTIAEARALYERVHDLVTGKLDVDKERASLGALAALSGVHKFAVRVKCASLPWHALRSALEGGGAAAAVSTDPR
jgi:nitrogen fixation NifU-like protein